MKKWEMPQVVNLFISSTKDYIQGDMMIQSRQGRSAIGDMTTGYIWYCSCCGKVGLKEGIRPFPTENEADNDYFNNHGNKSYNCPERSADGICPIS